jgi:putative glutamine amidotransferase
VDIATQVPQALNHQRMDKKGQVVHEITLEPDSLMASLCRTASVGVNSTHHQAVGRVAPPFRAVARSADGVVEAMELGRAEQRLLPYLLAVQFHPERLLGSSRAFLRLFQSFIAACGSFRRNVV